MPYSCDVSHPRKASRNIDIVLECGVNACRSQVITVCVLFFEVWGLRLPGLMACTKTRRISCSEVLFEIVIRFPTSNFWHANKSRILQLAQHWSRDDTMKPCTASHTTAEPKYIWDRPWIMLRAEQERVVTRQINMCLRVWVFWYVALKANGGQGGGGGGDDSKTSRFIAHGRYRTIQYVLFLKVPQWL